MMNPSANQIEREVEASRANLEETSFVRCSLAGARLGRVLMSRTSIEGGSLAGVTLDAAMSGSTSLSVFVSAGSARGAYSAR